MALDSLDGLERELGRLERITKLDRKPAPSAQAQEELELLNAIAHDMRCSTDCLRRRPRSGLAGAEVYQLLLGHLSRNGCEELENPQRLAG